jgi:hypothetical protein
MCDSDFEYMRNLMNYINSDRNNPMFALAFSDMSKLEAYMVNHTLDLLILDEDKLEEVKLTHTRILCLSREMGGAERKLTSVGGKLADKKTEHRENMAIKVGMLCEEPEDRVHVEYIYKFSKARDIVAAAVRLSGREFINRKNRVFKEFGIISPLGRCGKTNLAISLCMADEVRGGLYIGMEEYSSFQDQEDVMSNVFYLAKQRSEKFIPYVEEHVVKLESYSILGYMKSYMDAMELAASDMVWMMEKLKEWGRYSTIVWDLGQAVIKDLSILEVFDEVVMPVLDDEISVSKIKAFEEMLEREEMGKLAKRIKHVLVPETTSKDAAMMKLTEEILNSN